MTEHRARSPLRWVGQEDAQGCGVAVLAMLTGRTYADVRAQIDSEDGHGHDGDWATHGVAHFTLDRLLAAHGYYGQKRYRAWFEDRIVEEGKTRWELKPGAEWPPRPWAPVHYASVEQPSGRNHFVVVCADGVVLDPLREGEYRLTDWPGVNHVTGLQLIRAATSPSTSPSASIERAVADMRFARQTHADWADYLEHPQTDVREARPQEEVAGGAEHHRDWVGRYDRVIAILEGTA